MSDSVYSSRYCFFRFFNIFRDINAWSKVELFLLPAVWEFKRRKSVLSPTYCHGKKKWIKQAKEKWLSRCRHAVVVIFPVAKLIKKKKKEKSIDRRIRATTLSYKCPISFAKYLHKFLLPREYECIIIFNPPSTLKHEHNNNEIDWIQRNTEKCIC